ncbi:MAG: AAA family ATPase [Actinobacteria bacterium]|nr:AAA family ATPase [Actinomycetota bacterium]MBL7123563.1 AAA family ATPase [Actinomycetota bacterium]
MYLKNITLRGFKSFKNKSQLFFEPGISVIVGPNGSGKSNVADAISWVLGEQSPKSLRGSSMGDVIFRSKNEEMGIAEVSLMFDNSNKLFNTEFRDVKFTRRVFTRGGSEYFINSSPCRLIDIQELTADTGIGRGLYIIINQGQINEIAVLKPIERKTIIDEVLGISKHKNRRDKSLSKLQKVKNDIERINDLMEEIKRTMDPLEIEAKRAQKHSEIFNLLKNEEISLFIAHLNHLNNEWESENESYRTNKDELKEISSKILSIEKEKNDLLKLANKEQDEYEFWKNKIDWFNSEKNRLESIIALIESKKNVFSTLYNMFDLKFSSGTSNKNELKVSLEKDKNGIDISFLQKISNGLKRIDELLLKFLENLKKKVKDKNTARYVENEGNLIIEEIKKLYKVIETSQRSKDAISKKESQKGNEKQVDNFKKRLDRIRIIKNICMTNLERSKKIHSILNGYLSVSEDIKNKLYPEFERRSSLISGSQDKINELGIRLNQLNISRSNLENSIYKIDLKKEQIKEKVEAITENIVDNYNLSIDYALKSYSPSSDIKESEVKVKRFKNEIKKYGNVNPNASIEYNRIKKRFDFLADQSLDLVESKKNLEELIKDINERIANYFFKKFDEINQCFKNYFKILFPLGEGEMQLEKSDSESDNEIGVDLKVDIGNNKFVPLSLLSGGEKSLVSIAFLFSIYSINSSPFYVFDEVDASLDDVNIGRFLTLVKKFSEKQQIIIITHQKRTMEVADTIYGVTMQSNGISKIISEKIGEKYAEVN